MVPTGSTGFRITTKISPFWNIYFNALGVAVAERLEGLRSENAHSYRYEAEGDSLFDRDRSWRAYKEATLNDQALGIEGAVVVQTDISSFYEHIYHHRLENCVADLFEDSSTIPKQIDRLLNKFSAGRSFGFPVGGQCSRILAETLMHSIDEGLTASGVCWHRYVDDYTLITESKEDAYRALSILSHALADYGLSLNRTKTTFLSGKHYVDYVNTQLGVTDDESRVLREIDLHFDPYSDFAATKYAELKDAVKQIDIVALLNTELAKSTPDNFLVSQIGRTLKFQSPNIAINLCETLLNPTNLNAFRASWSTIMRGIAALRADTDHEEFFGPLDSILDKVPEHSAHLLLPEANCLHYLRTIRFAKTQARAQYVRALYERTQSETVKRACIECWRMWKDRASFQRVRNQWSTLSSETKRMLWLAAGEFGEEGWHFRNQTKGSIKDSFSLGIERNNKPSFAELYADWCKNGI